MLQENGLFLELKAIKLTRSVYDVRLQMCRPAITVIPDIRHRKLTFSEYLPTSKWRLQGWTWSTV